MSSLDDLRRIAPAPPAPPPAVDWEVATSALGVSLPADYMQLVNEWGAGTFGDFIVVFAPGHERPHLELVHEAKGWLWALEEQAMAGEDLPFPPRIAPGGLLAWGVSGNGDPCFWHLRSEDPASWTIAVEEARAPEWHLFEGGVVDFLVAVLEGRERVSVFPEDVPSRNPAFRRA